MPSQMAMAKLGHLETQNRDPQIWQPIGIPVVPGRLKPHALSPAHCVSVHPQDHLKVDRGHGMHQMGESENGDTHGYPRKMAIEREWQSRPSTIFRGIYSEYMMIHF